MYARTLRGLLLCCLVVSACAHPRYAQQQYPQAQQVPFEGSRGTSMLGSSSSFAEEDVDYSSSVKGKALAVPHRSRPADAVDLIVRPDTLIVELAIRDVRPTSTEALAAIS